MEADVACEESWRLPFAAVSVRAGRAHIARVLHSFQMAQSTVDDVCVVVSELLGNAVRHARPRLGGEILLTLEVDEASVSIAVIDGGSAHVPSLVRPPLLSLGGRGLGIVHTLTHDWGVREADDGTTVFAVLKRG